MPRRIAPPRAFARDALDAAARTDLATFIHLAFNEVNPGTEFVPTWHVEAIAYQLERVWRGEVRRLIINMPPRSLKSLSASVAFPAFVHMHDPTRRIMNVTYGQELSAALARDYRSVIQSQWYRRLAPGVCIDPQKDAETEILLTARGSRIATSVGGVLTGRGAHIIIIDDPLKASDAPSETKRAAVNAWYGSALISRLDDKDKGAVVIVTQRLHIDDLVGHVLQNSEEWEVLNLPAIANRDLMIPIGPGAAYPYLKGQVLVPERETLAMLEQLRREQGSAAFSAQYLQEPVPLGGNMFQREWLRRFDGITNRHAGDEIIQSWDVAAKTGVMNDWSTCVTLLKRGGEFHLIDVYRARLEYPQLRRDAVRQAQRYNPRVVLVEDIGVGTALISDLRRSGVKSHPIRSVASKIARAQIQTPKFEGGLVLLPHKAPWLDEFEAELLAFPGGRHDDQVDALCQALAYNRPLAKTRVYGIRM